VNITFSQRRRILYAVSLLCVLLTLAAIGLRTYLHSPSRGLTYHDSFASSADEWKSFGGTWETVDGAMRNNSDERGAKLLTGSHYWRDYLVEADIMLLGQRGDAGLIVRSSDEELGVDSYTGYYAGLRNYDNSLVLGRASHGWMENVLRLNPSQGGVQAFQWYHLKVLAYGCQIVVTASLPNKPAVVAITDKNCIPSGRIGLRSYSSGGVWRNVVARSATQQDLVAMLGQSTPHETSTAQPSSSKNSEMPVLIPSRQYDEVQSSRSGITAQAIANLRLASFAKPVTATIRGVVILTSPVLFVQDSTGGVYIPQPNAPPLKVGDEVEVTGQVRPGDFSSTLEHATVQVLWARSPMPAVSVTASQAATGAFDATFIEVEGRLRAKQYVPENTLVLDLDAGSQSFRAIMNRGRSDSLFSKLKPNSLLRLRGICVVDSAFTHNLTPFVILLRSTDDADILAGPPWWSARHIIAIAVALVLLALIANFLYSRVENWRLRAVMQERERLAHEMHDTLAQSFAGIGFQIEAIRNGVPEDDASVHQHLDLASDLVQHSHEEARRSIATLRPEPLESIDLLIALDRCAHRMVEGGTVRVIVSSSGDARSLPLRTADTLYRIGQEAIANAVRHAHPTTLSISLSYEKHVIRLIVEDNGTGFIQSGDLRGFGLRGMRRRAQSISATLQISSSPGDGTRIHVRAPLPPRMTLVNWPKFLWNYLREQRSNDQRIRHAHPNSYRG